MTSHKSLARQIIVLIIGCALALGAIGQNAIKRLDSYETQRRGWQEFRDLRQTQLNDKLRDLANVRSDADEKGKHEAFQKAADKGLDKLGQGVGKAFKAAVTGEGMPAVAKDAFKRARQLDETVNAGKAWNKSTADRQENEAKIAAQDAEVAALQRQIGASNQALTLIVDEMAQITRNRTYPPIVIGWFRQLENAINAAAGRQDARRREKNLRGERGGPNSGPKGPGPQGPKGPGPQGPKGPGPQGPKPGCGGRLC